MHNAATAVTDLFPFHFIFIQAQIRIETAPVRRPTSNSRGRRRADPGRKKPFCGVEIIQLLVLRWKPVYQPIAIIGLNRPEEDGRTFCFLNVFFFVLFLFARLLLLHYNTTLEPNAVGFGLRTNAFMFADETSR